MAAAILTEDFLAVCLYLVDGDVDARLEQIIARAEEYQEHSNRHFGISRSDYRSAFYALSFEVHTEKGIGDYKETLERYPFLRQWIDPILAYEDVYFNDEGEHWWPGDGLSPSKTRLKMQAFFSKSGDHNPAAVNRFLGELGKDSTILMQCSRPGNWS